MRQTVVDKERENGKKRKKEIERKEINKKSGKLKKKGIVVILHFHCILTST